MNTANISRGEQMRRALLAIARTCHARGLLLPSYATIGDALGVSQSQVSRHMGRLLDEDALQIAQAGRRLRIRSIAP